PDHVDHVVPLTPGSLQRLVEVVEGVLHLACGVHGHGVEDGRHVRVVVVDGSPRDTTDEHEPRVRHRTDGWHEWAHDRVVIAFVVDDVGVADPARRWYLRHVCLPVQWCDSGEFAGVVGDATAHDGEVAEYGGHFVIRAFEWVDRW